MPDSAPVSSRWWYVVAVTTVYDVLVFAALLLLLPLVLLAALGAAPGDLPVALGLSMAAVLAIVVPLALLGMLLALLFPVAIYADAEAVAAANLDWDPDPFLYGLLGVAGLFSGGAPVQPVLGLYYLYRRHQHVGTP
ncbi:MAG: hypothetical protein ABEJ68_02555 [Halobacteriaceae archaeon]